MDASDDAAARAIAGMPERPYESHDGVWSPKPDHGVQDTDPGEEQSAAGKNTPHAATQSPSVTVGAIDRAGVLPSDVTKPGDLPRQAPASLAPAVENAAPAHRQEGLALVGALVGAIIGKLDTLYTEVLTAKDSQLAAKDELIAELRRRVEQAERGTPILEHESAGNLAPPSLGELTRLRAANARQAEELRLLRTRIMALGADQPRTPESRAAAFVPYPARELPAGVGDTSPLNDAPLRAALLGEPAAVAAEEYLPRQDAHQARGLPLRRRRGGLVAVSLTLAVVAGVVLVAGLSHRPGAAAPKRAAQSAPTAFLPFPTVPFVARRVVGDAIGLLAPRAAVALPHGYIVVADTGNHRLALLDNAGRLVRSQQAPVLRRPIAIVAAATAFYVLDAGRGAIDRYDLAGRFVRAVAHMPALRDATAMALDRRHGLLYVAGPRLASIIAFSANGRIRRRLGAPRGAGYGRFGRPMALAFSGNNNLYVLDAARQRLVELTPAGEMETEWPVPVATARGPASLLPLSDGRVLVATPGGDILVYSADSNLPVFLRALALPGGHGHARGPLGLSRTSQGDILIADTQGNRMLIVPRRQGS